MAKSWTDNAPQPKVLQDHAHLRDSISYRIKRKLLGNPLNRHTLSHQRLSKRYALGVLSSDCISSSAYGSEQILRALLPAFGLAAFSILMPMTIVVLIVLVIVTFSYREVVSIYTKSGGAYVVSRDNLSPLAAQLAAVALMLDYIVTVAIQSSAGVDAIISTFENLQPYKMEMIIAIILFLTYGNLRGVKEAGKAFAFPTYFFVGSMLVVFVTGIIRSISGDLPKFNPSVEGSVSIGQSQSLLTFAAIFILLRAFANGGASLTGLEAISDGVTLFKSPEGVNARKTLVMMSLILGSLVFGISYFAHLTLATPYETGSPTVISQIAKATLGSGTFGAVFFYIVQAATMLILFAGANTAYSGFPYLVNFVANDGYLPRQLTKRGHRLAFSNGIILLAAAATILAVATGGSVEHLVAFYALGVFTGFSLTGFGMARKSLKEKQSKWRRSYVINLISGVVSFVIVIIFAVVKFSEGAWLILAITPILVMTLLRLNRQYKAEIAVLNVPEKSDRATSIARHDVTVLVDNVDLATIGTVRYARSLNPRNLTAVHFVIDDRRAEKIRNQWNENDSTSDISLELIDCPDRRIANAAVDYAIRTTASPDVELTLLLPRRAYSKLLGRLLHDQTADEIARPISQLERVVATIVPFDVERILNGTQDLIHPKHEPIKTIKSDTPARLQSNFIPVEKNANNSTDAGELQKIGSISWRNRAQVQGKVTSIKTAPNNSIPSVDVEIWDETGGLTLRFLGKNKISGLSIGRRIEAEGMVGENNNQFVIINPKITLMEF